jgi:hypothetical protein
MRRAATRWPCRAARRDLPPDFVTVVFGFVPLRGAGQDQDSICLSAPPARYPFTLTEPLGQRRLLDGSTIPPRDATKPPN